MDRITYTGIGSRSTPEEYLAFFQEIGSYLSQCGLTLRSGGADGADSAFESGCDRVLGRKQIFLPWPGFNGKDSKYDSPPARAYEIAKKYHPMWIGMKRSVQRLHARNSQQILGPELDCPSLFVLCWTNPNKGGTTQALRVARSYNIPIYNYYVKSYNIEDILEQFDGLLDQGKKKRSTTTYIRKSQLKKGAF